MGKLNNKASNYANNSAANCGNYVNNKATNCGNYASNSAADCGNAVSDNATSDAYDEVTDCDKCGCHGNKDHKK